MTKIVSDNIKHHYNDDIESQVYKIIMKYTSNNKSLMCNLYYNSNNGQDNFLNFVNNAYIYILEHDFLSRYDKNKSTISTYVYTIMKYLTPLFLIQTKYNVSSQTARLMLTKRNNIGDSVRSIYQNSSYIDMSTSRVSLNNHRNCSDEDISFTDNNLLDDNSDPYYLMIENNMDYYTKILDDAIIRYCDTHGNKQNRDRNIDILRKYLIFNNYDNLIQDKKFTLEQLGECHSLTKERVRQIIQKFRTWVINDSKIKELLPSI